MSLFTKDERAMLLKAADVIDRGEPLRVVANDTGNLKEAAILIHNAVHAGKRIGKTTGSAIALTLAASADLIAHQQRQIKAQREQLNALNATIRRMRGDS